MVKELIQISDQELVCSAGPDDFIQLVPIGGATPLFYTKAVLLLIGECIVRGIFCHLSGPTGSGKTSLLEALYLESQNWSALCQILSAPKKPLRVYEIESVDFESPGELRQRRALQNGSTYDEESKLVAAFRSAAAIKSSEYPAIYFKEIGRVHSATVQNGLLNLMRDDVVLLPDGTRVDVSGVAFVADSNYQAESDATHTLVTFDEALKRRFPVNLTLNYIEPEIEIRILHRLIEQGHLQYVDHDLIEKLVTLGALVRKYKQDGELASVVPPTLYGYINMLRLTTCLAEFGAEQVVLNSILGNVSSDDAKMARGLFHQVFGLKVGDEADPTLGGVF